MMNSYRMLVGAMATCGGHETGAGGLEPQPCTQYSSIDDALQCKDRHTLTPDGLQNSEGFSYFPR